jgi:hypothetical protein
VTVVNRNRLSLSIAIRRRESGVSGASGDSDETRRSAAPPRAIEVAPIVKGTLI